jgi:hypothetical protein
MLVLLIVLIVRFSDQRLPPQWHAQDITWAVDCNATWEVASIVEARQESVATVRHYGPS